MKYLNIAFGLFPPVLQTWLTLLLVRRGAYKSFPFFFSYTVFAVVAELCKFVVARYSQHPMVYFYLYWSAETIYAALGFLAIHEVFRRVFENFRSLPWFKFLLPIVGLGMIAISALISIVHRAVETPPLLEGIYSLQIAVRCLQIGVFFLIFFLARTFELDYRQYAFGIAAGFGIAAAGILLGTLVRTALGLKSLMFFQYVLIVPYCIAVTVWLVSFVRPEPDDPFRDFRHMFTPDLFLGRLEKYKQDVRGMFRP